MPTEPVIVAYKDGREFEVESAAVAKKAHPDAEVVRFARTQEPYKAGEKPAAPLNVVEPITPAATLTEHTPDEPPAKAKQ